MELVSFISIEDDPPDLILSFAIWQPELEDIRSLVLMRTQEYEFILDETERGVKVSCVMLYENGIPRFIRLLFS